jgi:hypothetical protein
MYISIYITMNLNGAIKGISTWPYGLSFHMHNIEPEGTSAGMAMWHNRSGNTYILLTTRGICLG